MPLCVFITSRWCKCGVCCLCPCNFPQSENQNKPECVAHSITVSHHGGDLERALWQGGGRLFHEWWMIYGVNCFVSIYFSHWCKSVSQPRPRGSLRVSPGPRPFSLWRVLLRTSNTATQSRLFARSKVRSWAVQYMGGGSPCCVSMLALQVSKIYHVCILKASRTKVSQAAVIKKNG